MRKAQHVVAGRRGSAADAGSRRPAAAMRLLRRGAETVLVLVGALAVHGTVALAQALPSAADGQRPDVAGTTGQLTALAGVPASCTKAYELGPAQELGPNWSPGPACTAAAACADSIDRQLAQIDALLASNPALAQQLDAIDKERSRTFDLTGDIRYHLKTFAGRVINKQNCSGALNGLSGSYYRNGSGGLGKDPPFQRFANAAQQFVAASATQFSTDMAALADLQSSLARYPARAELEQAEAAYRRAAEGGDTSAAAAARPAFLAAVAAAQAYAGNAKANAAALGRMRHDSAALVAELINADLAPFVAAGAADEAREVAARAEALAARSGDQSGDGASQLELLTADLEGVALQRDDARRALGRAKAQHDALFGDLTRARAMLTAAGELGPLSAPQPQVFEELRAVTKTVRGFLGLPLPELVGRQAEVEQAKGAIDRLETVVNAAKADAERRRAQLDADAATRPANPSASASTESNEAQDVPAGAPLTEADLVCTSDRMKREVKAAVRMRLTSVGFPEKDQESFLSATDHLQDISSPQGKALLFNWNTYSQAPKALKACEVFVGPPEPVFVTLLMKNPETGNIFGVVMAYGIPGDIAPFGDMTDSTAR